MSALATRHQVPAYAVREDPNSPLPARRFALTGPTGAVVDRFRSVETADSYCRALNAGRAEIVSHALIGCHVRVLGYVR